MSRHTGRTTRMIAQALDEAKSGRRVYVVGSDASHSYQMWAMCQKMTCSRDHAGGFGYNHDDHGKSIGLFRGHNEVGRIFFVPPKGTFDWQHLCFLDGRLTAIVHVDHHAIEQRFSKMLEELHRYDDTPKNVLDQWSKPRCIVCGNLQPCPCLPRNNPKPLNTEDL